jgi:hypothetical protein
MVDERDNFWENRARILLEHEHNVRHLTDAEVSALIVKIGALREISPKMDTWIDEVTQAERTSRGRIIALLDEWSQEELEPEHFGFIAEVEAFRNLVGSYVTASTPKDRFPSNQDERYMSYARLVDALFPEQVEKGMEALTVLEQALESYIKKEGIQVKKMKTLLQYIQKKDIDGKEKLITVLIRLDELNNDVKHPVFEHFIFNDAVRALHEAGLLVKQKPQSVSVIEAQKAKETHFELIEKEDEMIWAIAARVGALSDAQVDSAFKAADALSKQAELLMKEDDSLGMKSLLETINRSGLNNKTKLRNILTELEFSRLPNLRNAPDSELKDAFFSKNNDFQWYTGSETALTPLAEKKAGLEALNETLWDDKILKLEDEIQIQEEARGKLVERIEELDVYLVQLKGNTAIASRLREMAEEKQSCELKILEVDEKLDVLEADLSHFQALASDDVSPLFNDAPEALAETELLPPLTHEDLIALEANAMNYPVDEARRYLDMIKAYAQHFIEKAPASYEVYYLKHLVKVINQGDLNQVLKAIRQSTLPMLKNEMFRELPDKGVLASVLPQQEETTPQQQLIALKGNLEDFQRYMMASVAQVSEPAPVRRKKSKVDDGLDDVIEARVAGMSDEEIQQACVNLDKLQAQAELLRDRTQHVTSKLFSTAVDKEAKSVHENMNRLLRIIKSNKPDLEQDDEARRREKVGTVLLHLEGAKTLTWLNQDKTLDALGARFSRVDMLLSPFVAAVNAFRWCFNLEPIQSPISVESFKTDLLELKKDVDAGHEDENDLDGFSKQ